ncbi:MAG: LysR family transcriptional regulator [Oscillospiraceae bacterium]|nr:LysR family transcriptional regulator [Oscillospiraceae bacterium]
MDETENNSEIEAPEKKGRLCYHIRLTIGTSGRAERDEIFFGPGVHYLLEQINKFGSILMATKEMKMAYSKSWKMIRNLERNLGFRVLARHVGRGSDSKLTPKGEEFVAAYGAFLEEVGETASKSFEKHFARFLRKEE